MYTVMIPEPVEKELLKRFDTPMPRRLHKRIKKLETAPDVHGKPLRGPLGRNMGDLLRTQVARAVHHSKHRLYVGEGLYLNLRSS